MRRPEIADCITLLLLVVLLGGVYVATYRPGHDWGGDFALYLLQARNLARGTPYHDTGYIVDRTTATYVSPAMYPPVFPLVLAPVYRHYGLDYRAFKILVVSTLLLAVVFYYVLGRLQGLSPLLSASAVAIFALSGLVLWLNQSVLSESTHMLFASASLVLITMTYRRGWDRSRPFLSGAAIVVLILLAYGTRTIAIALPLSFLCFEVWHARRIRPFAIGVGAALLAAGLVYSACVYDGRAYGDQFSFTPALYVRNALHYLRTPAVLWAAAPKVIRWILYVVALLVAGGEFTRRLRRPGVVEFYAVISLLPLILYSSGCGDRYLISVLPLFCIYLMSGLDALAGWRFPVRRHAVVIGCLVALAAVSALNVRAADRAPILEGVEKPTFVDVCAWIRQHLPADATLLSWNPRVLALYTDRPSAWSAQTRTVTEFNERLKDLRVSYVLVYESEEANRSWLVPHVQAQPERFQPVYRNPDFAVYRVAVATASR
jgi:hypothetical protein